MPMSALSHAEPGARRRACQRPRHGGFTLIEMVVVVALVGLLASAAFPLLALQTRRQKESDLRLNLRTLRLALDAYQQASLDGTVAAPLDLTRGGSQASGFPPTLQTLVDGVPDARAPTERKLYFLRRLPRDPMAPAALPAALTWGLRSHDSPADAPQPGRDVFDVHSQSDGSGLDGTPYRSW